MPWEVISAMENAVMDGKTSFSRSGAASKGTSWLSVIIPTDVEILRGYLESMKNLNHVPEPLSYLDSGLPLVAFDANTIDDDNDDNNDVSYYTSRYDSTILWIDDAGHAMIGNGPFYLDSYSPESRSIRIISFDDKTYPFERGTWSGFERAAFPLIMGVDIKNPIIQGEQLHVDVATENSDSLLYFVINASGHVISSSTYDVAYDAVYDDTMNPMDDSLNYDMNQFDSVTHTKITVSANDTAHLSNGANSIRIFALSDTVLKPDYYETGFFAFGSNETDFTLTPVLPGIQNANLSDIASNAQSNDIFSLQPVSSNDESNENDYTNIYYLMLVVGIISIASVIVMRIITKVRKLD